MDLGGELELALSPPHPTTVDDTPFAGVSVPFLLVVRHTDLICLGNGSREDLRLLSRGAWVGAGGEVAWLR